MPGSYTATAPPLEALTEREEEVLALIARGKTNGEIANELGITFNTAKTHVARILSKLGVETREEAAAWRRAHPEPVSAPRRRRRWGLFGLPLAAKVAAGAVTAVAVGGLATLGAVLMVTNGDGDEESADAATETPATTVTETEEATPGESVTPPVPDGERCAANGSVLNFEPVFCARWEAYYGDEIAYDVTLRYGDPQTGETFTYPNLPVDETVFIFPGEAWPYEQVPLDQCMARTQVMIQLSTTREPPAGDFFIHEATATLECVEDGDGLYTAVPVNTPSAFPLDFASFTIGEPVPFDPGYAHFIATGCWGCDGPTSGVERMYIDEAGELQRDTLFDVATLLPDLGAGQGYLAGYDYSDDFQTWVAAVCHGYCGGVAEPDPDSSITLHRSVDGVVWEQLAEIEGPHHLNLLQADGGILISRWLPEEQRNEYILWRDDEVIPAPPPFGAAGTPEAYQLEDGTLLFRTEGGQALVSADETIRLPLPSAGGFPGTPAVLPGTERRFLTHYDEGYSPSQSLVVYDANEPVAAYSLDGLNAIVWDWFDETRLMGNIATYFPAEVTGNFPAYFDLSTGTIHLIDGPFVGLGEGGADPDDLAGRNYLFAAVPGPFARVATGDGDCLNVREAPSDGAGVLVCHADGVLLRLTGEEAEADGFTWLAVTTPDGRAGWVAAEFVAR